MPTAIGNDRKVTVTIEGMGTYTIYGSVEVNLKQNYDWIFNELGMVIEAVCRAPTMGLKIEGIAFPETFDSAINIKPIKLESKPDQKKVCRLILIEE